MHRMTIVSLAAALAASCSVSSRSERAPARAAPREAPSGGGPGVRADVREQENGPAAAEASVIVTASVQLAIDDVRSATAALREKVAAAGGKIVAEEIALERGEARFSLRVPPGALESFLSSLESVGAVRERTVGSRDVSKQVFDDRIALDNLKKALARYQDILREAKAVSEVLQVQAQLDRVRGEIERLEGELKFLADQVALATVEVTMTPHAAPVFAPTARLYPGLTLLGLSVYHRDEARRSFGGLGLSIYLQRALHFDVALAKHDGARDFDVVELTAAFDTYSELLGAGRRTFLNPYVGMAVGAAWLDDLARAELAATAGLELLKTRWVLVDAHLRFGAWMRAKSVEGFVEPALTLNVAF